MTFQVTSFQSIKSTNGTARTLDDLIAAIKTDSTTKQQARRSSNPDQRRFAKQSLPVWFTGGVMTGGSDEKSISEFNGLAQIDIDSHISTERGEALKASLFQCPYCVLSCISASGTGAWGLINVGELQKDKGALEYLYEALKAILNLNDDEELDASGAKVAQRRFESYDPAPLIREDAPQWSLQDIRTRALDAFNSSDFKAAANFFGDDPKPNSAAVGATLMALALHMRGRVKGAIDAMLPNANGGFELPEHTYYPFKMQAVILGDSGSGKSTCIKEPLQKLAHLLGARIASPESDRTLELEIVESCTDVTYPIDERTGKLDTKNPEYQQCEPAAVLCISDEAAAEAKARKGGIQYKSRMDAVNRKGADTTFIPNRSINTKMPTFPLINAYNHIQLSTPKAWAEANHYNDDTIGDARRIYEFWIDKPRASKNIPDWLASYYHQPKQPNIDGFYALLETRFNLENRSALDDSRSLNLGGYLNPWDFGECIRVLRQDYHITNDDFKTVITKLSTAIAFCRESQGEINTDDQLAAWAIYFGILDNRARLADLDAPEAISWEDKITKEICRALEKAPMRMDNFRRKFKSAAQSKALDELIKTAQVVQYSEIIGKVRRNMLRLATPEETEKAWDTSLPATVQPVATATAQPVSIATTTTTPTSRAKITDTPEAEQRKRIRNYIEQHHKNDPLINGNIDNSLHSLCGKFRKNGMHESPYIDDEMTALCIRLGHTDEKDIRRVLRNLHEAPHEKD